MNERKKEFLNQINKNKTSEKTSFDIFLAKLEDTEKNQNIFKQNLFVLETEFNEIKTLFLKLSDLCENKNFFDNYLTDISITNNIIKQKIQKITFSLERIWEFAQTGNTKLLNIYSEIKRKEVWNKTTQEHIKIVINTMQKRVRNLSENCKKVLESRTENIEKHRKKTEMLLNYSEPFSQQSFYSTKEQRQEYLTKEKTKNINKKNVSFQNVEESLSEMGTVFQHMAILVKQQGEVVQRLDRNVEETVDNVSYGKEQISMYLTRISSQRRFIIKIFLFLLFFILILFLFFKIF